MPGVQVFLTVKDCIQIVLPEAKEHPCKHCPVLDEDF